MGGDVSKLAIAKKFAKRRALYRTKSAKAYERAMADDDIRNSFWERAERFQMAAETVEHLWLDIRGDL